MKIEITNMKDNPDGSADCELNIDADGMAFLIQEGLISVLWKAIDQAKKESNKTIPFYGWLHWLKK